MEYLENAIELVETLKQFMRLSKRHLFIENIGFNDMMIIKLLVEQKDLGGDETSIQLKDLSDKLNISRPALNNIINKLEDQSYVERFRTKGDRKSVYLRLTENSYHLHEKQNEKMINFMNDVVSSMGKDKTKEFIALLKQFYEIMEELQGEC